MGFSISRAKAANYLERAKSAAPEEAAHLHSMAAHHLQKTFQRLSGKSYPSIEVAELVIEVASLRRAASTRYQAVGGTGGIYMAGMELSRGARCMEAYAKYLIENAPAEPPVSKEHLTQLLNEALRYRSSAAGFFRSHNEDSMELAFELSYRSRTLSFLIKQSPAHNTSETLDEIIKDLTESTFIFERHLEYKEAYFGYWHLTMSLMDRARTDPSFYVQAIVSAHKSIEMIEKGRLDPERIPQLYRVAASAYRRLARATADSYMSFYVEQAKEMALKAIEAGDTTDGETTLS